MNLKTIVITWLDDLIATYENATASVADGTLHVHVYAGPAHLLRDEWHSRLPASGPGDRAPGSRTTWASRADPLSGRTATGPG
jgi:hypothetical protein